MSSRPVVTLTLNPALDLTVQLPELIAGEVNLADRGSLRAAGKGINVAMVLRDLGEQVCVTGVLGQDNREKFDALFVEHQMVNYYQYEQGATRINVKLSETSGRVTDVNLPGLVVSETSWQQLQRTLLQLCEKADWFVLSGSLPKGLATDAYGHICNLLRERGKKVVIDTSGKALHAAVEAAPEVIKPNVQELEQWAGKPLPTQALQEEAVRSLLNRQIRHVVLSDGENGLRWYSREGAWQALPPKVDVVSTVGAGDSLVAGISYGLMNNFSVADTLTLATAVAAMAVNQVGVGITSPLRLDQLKQQVSIKPLSFSC
ncbi:1-phosphofructokinase [Gynuella sunshinyii]|uniref:Phosphofructokinase n=1 Tax=Gynuella sunshinyii YC6258 TaxID=1445510 RepID=A0A0C5VNY4_9GAMM|nr:1-phosphofructokinase [Gynuella sunshinyii]AJQ95113.1 fructose-1-phosphate kinase and related fructose-6-phosphate kinase (PfkB) [Gynuella sunshinyii YC6258]